MSEVNINSVIPDSAVSALPTKKFFVSMLTRDIELRDAIMDLIDNCLDGVHRIYKKNNIDKETYDGYYCRISINPSKFIIEDNCGGIPLHIAKQYAFKMGRDPNYHEDDDLETLGMYGIGMKRAIFKMGFKAEVISYHEENNYKVIIPEDWQITDKWYFDYDLLSAIDSKDTNNDKGTTIIIENLHNNIKDKFGDSAGFLKDLEKSLKDYYGFIIQQGFKIILNDIEIEPLEINLLTSTTGETASIKPYAYKARLGDIDIEVLIGFYRPPASSEEIENELNGDIAKSSSENAGITVICNDRVVLFCDKTLLTGWGESPVPKYHTQFINIAGVVHFHSSNPISLPVTTTKRNLDTSSLIYAEVKVRIKEGLRIFTNFTNQWKSPSSDRLKLFDNTEKINILRPGQTSSEYVQLKKKGKDDDSLYQIPILPKPKKDIVSNLTQISFKREPYKVEKISDTIFPGESKSPNEIGAWCFDEILKQIE